MTTDVTAYFGPPCPLICLPVLQPILSCLVALSQVLKVHSVHFWHLLCFFKIVLITLPSLHFPLDFRISLALSLERTFWDSESVCIGSIDQAEGYRRLNKFKCPCLLLHIPRSLRCADVLRQLFRFSFPSARHEEPRHSSSGWVWLTSPFAFVLTFYMKTVWCCLTTLTWCVSCRTLLEDLFVCLCFVLLVS